MKRLVSAAVSWGLVLATAVVSAAADADPAGLLPPAGQIKPDRPRMLLRPAGTTRAVTIEELKAIPRDEEFGKMLGQLRGEKSAAAQAMVYLLTGEKPAADAAVKRMREFKAPKEGDPFAVYFGLRELALAYDWLHGYEGFPKETREEVRKNAAPLVEAGLRISNDHLFHNYVWQSAGGVALWALATVGEAPECDKVYETIRARLNERLFPGMEYLAGAPGEPMWYWALYDLSPAALTVLAGQSASDLDFVARIREAKRGDWLARQLAHTIGCTVPDLSYTPFGDTKSGSKGVGVGPDGGVTHEMTGVLSGLTRLLDSKEGAWFDRWIAGKRGLKRFYGETGIFYFLYTRTLKAAPAEPPLAVFAGSREGGQIVSRSGWDDGAAVVAFRCTDHFGDHNHYDQGSFMIWKNGWLAIDPTVYKKVRGPQQPSEHHNTLLLAGKGQRPVRGQDFTTLDSFKANLAAGAKLETGDMVFYQDTPEWTAAAGQFAQAYPADVIRICGRQMLFVRPGTLVIVDRLAALEGKELPEVQWLLHVPKGPAIDAGVVTASNGKSWLRCRQLLPGGGAPAAAASIEPSFERVTFTAKGGPTLVLVHVLEIGDGTPSDKPVAAEARMAGLHVEVTVAGKAFVFADAPCFKVALAASGKP
jgi:hypothetical protein